MSDFVYCETGDWDSGENIGFIVGRGNTADYVESGLEIASVDYAASEFITTAGKFYALLDQATEPNKGKVRHLVLVGAWMDERTNLPLAGSGVNHVYARMNYGDGDDPTIETNTTGNAPSDDSVKIATIDTGNETVQHVNRDPDGTFDVLSSNSITISDQITWPDGATTETHPIAYGETIDNQNEYYDAQANDPPGVVANAASAQSAQEAVNAEFADEADQAGNSTRFGGHTVDELLARAESLRAQPWDPLFSQPYTNDSYNTRPYAEFNVSQYDYDYYRVRLHVENDSAYSDALGCYINGIDDDVYNMLNLLPRDQYGERVAHRTGTDTWTVGSTAAYSHSLHEFLIGLPSPIVGGGARYRFPIFNAATQLTGGDIGSYQLAGNLTRSVDSIDEILVETSGSRLAIRAQVYGRYLFPEQHE